jgi:hypothetical protein
MKRGVITLTHPQVTLLKSLLNGPTALDKLNPAAYQDEYRLEMSQEELEAILDQLPPPAPEATVLNQLRHHLTQTLTQWLG